MEYGLRGRFACGSQGPTVLVLILVLMEYGLRADTLKCQEVESFVGLNPCFNGIWSARSLVFRWMNSLISVLILVLMEYGLREALSRSWRVAASGVLILVLMEYGLRETAVRGTVSDQDRVLILVLMEYGLREYQSYYRRFVYSRS